MILTLLLPEGVWYRHAAADGTEERRYDGSLNLKHDLKHLYNPSAKAFTVINVPPMNFLMVDGAGDPNTAPAYRDAIAALYAVAYTLKFDVKKSQGIDYPVMASEGLWWSDNMDSFSLGRRDEWQWTMMIMQPDIITEAMVAAAVKKVQDKKDLPAAAGLRLERFHEGLSAQIMHIGAYAAEGPTIARMHQEFIPANGYELRGKHHEIYLSDPGRTAPEKLKTIIRQPVRPKG